MTLIIDNVDYSAYVQQKTGIVETPRYVNGSNKGTAINGSAIFDRVATKYDISFDIKPMPSDMLSQLVSACEENESSITYTSFLDSTDRTITGQCSITKINYIKTQNDERIYGECSISITEK